MTDKLLRPLILAGALIVSAALGAAIHAWIAPRIAGDTIREYLLEHPEVLPEAMGRLQEREAVKAREAQLAAQGAVAGQIEALTKPYAGAWAGNPDGDVTVVAFLDYACGYCRASLPGINELLAKDPKVRVVYREYPVLGPESVSAAQWALAAAEQGKFRVFHEALYEAGASAQGIEQAAAKAGLDKGVAARAVASKPVEAEILRNRQLGETLAMTGTPSWVIGGKLIYGAQTYEGLAQAVAAARAGR